MVLAQSHVHPTNQIAMSFAVNIKADSIKPDYAGGQRLTTFELTYPRFIHSEMLTHRVFSRNSASSRAIPFQKMLRQVLENPVIPIEWGMNQRGMQAQKKATPHEIPILEQAWLAARDKAVGEASLLNSLGMHKQIVNRLLEPFMWITVIVSSTQWSNFFALRCHRDAEPHIRRLACHMRNALEESHPRLLSSAGDIEDPLSWHLPYSDQPNDKEIITIRPDVIPFPRQVLVSAGRTARVSYLTHDGNYDPEADMELALHLAEAGHWSPWEHQAIPDATPTHGNFDGYNQARHFLDHESIKP